ncbi:adenylosuccinate lyase [Candidatus Woesebacteria bacterium RBG_16_34_12]|uniref:Adenylosuccinate lyase n=1 Tax=Candidatus Woesebacteria bacterium RBG_16_34_12 TaxID=1802480 RepID=A0A1F7XAW3_9BACT|nr:MAG: adenylosuccinate lyase [Candidatus Woesebacteria bacterium RBG_16_34_12]
MKLIEPLYAISPVDGRYRGNLEELLDYFSEYALIKYRIKVEVLYLIELSEIRVIRKLSAKEKKFLLSIFQDFTLYDARRVKIIEKEINHDLKAVEYLIKEKISRTSLKDISEFVHFGLTSWDINNIAFSLMIKDCLEKSYFATLKSLIKEIESLAKKYKNLSMLSRTHGQPASPTTLGKEFAIFASRLEKQIQTFPQLTGKLNGAVGNYNAHLVAFPKVDWIKFSNNFVESLGLKPNLITTQIEDYDTFAQTFQTMVRVNNILIDFNRDIWTYISLDYLKQKVNEGEVGSSTMPHKVNPIDFENSEGNLGIANSLLNHFANKLPISRLQRDLTDSTVTRTFGVAFGHSILAFNNTLKGLSKIEANYKVIKTDLNSHPEILAEAIQSVLRREGAKMPYEELKELTRGKKVTLEHLHKFIEKLKVKESVKKELKGITPENYIGLAKKLI